MAFFSLDFLVLLCSLFVFVRIEKFFHFSHYVLRNLTFLQVPGAEVWKEYLSRSNKPDAKLKRRGKGKKRKDVNNVDRNELPFYLISIDPKRPVLNGHPFFNDLEYSISLSATTLFVYLLSDISNCMADKTNKESSSLLLAGVAFLCISSMNNVAVQLWSYETSLSVIAGFFSMLICLGMFGIVPMPFVLDFEVQKAIEEVASLSSTSIEVAWWVVIPSLSMLCGFWSFLIFLGSFRYARCYSEFFMHVNSKRTLFENLWRLLTLFSPFLISLLYVRPIVEPVMVTLLGSNSLWYLSRYYISVALCMVRLFYFRQYMNCYGDSIRYVINDMQREPQIFGHDQLRKAVDFSYRNICTAGVQYLTPTIASISLLFLTSRFCEDPFQACSLTREMVGIPAFSGAGNTPSTFTTLLQASFPDASFKKMVFPQRLIGFVLSFSFWWTNMSWFIFSVIGVVYWNANKSRETRVSKWAKLYGTQAK